MLTAALLELMPDPEGFVDELNALGIPGVKYQKETSVKCGITGTHMRVTVDGEEEESQDHHHHHEHSHEHHDHEQYEHGHHHAFDYEQDHEHSHHSHEHGHHHAFDYEQDHEHDHHSQEHHEHGYHHAFDYEHESEFGQESEHAHQHASLQDIEHIVKDHLKLPADVQEDVMAVYGLIAEAESHAHGVPVTEIHFHEVGNMDAIADIVAVSLLMKRLAPEKIVVSPVHVGSGQVHCAHGFLPVPAPATAYILKDAPLYGGSIRGELCTPTGAALLKHFATEFGNMPVMSTTAIGYGMGKKDFEVANCVRVMLGESLTLEKLETLGRLGKEAAEKSMDAADLKKKAADAEASATAGDEKVYELSCNVDDMTGEEVGFAMERLFEAGARDVYTIPIGMKKNRPGILIRALCVAKDKEKLVEAMFRHTTTIGIRECALDRYILNREIVKTETPYGEIRRKASSGYGAKREKIEFEDLARIAREKGISLWEAREML